MSKFVKVKRYNDFEKIGAYIKNNKKCNYCIAPKLMNSIVNSHLRSAIDIGSDAIKQEMQNKIDLITMSVYNNVFEAKAFRIEYIKFNGSLLKTSNSRENEYVAFGLDGDEELFLYSELEVLD